MRILWHSNAPWSPVGYGQQTAIFTPIFRDAGHDVAISAFWGLGGTSLEWQGMPVYPADEAFGNKWLVANAHDHAKGGDIKDVQIITLMDVWVMNSLLLKETRLASWVPVDHMPTPPAVVSFFNELGSTPIAMSRFGERMLQESGLDPLYVPHGIKTDLMRPLDKAEVKRMLKLPEDSFVVGMVAANKGTAPSRKAYPEVFQAFGRFQREHKDAILYIHASASPGGDVGLNLLALAELCGVDQESLRFTPEFELYRGVPEEKMPYVFNCMDVLVNPSYGEGFGIPIIEAQACGVPVITNDFSAMRELTGAGWSVGGFPWLDASQGAFYQAPDPAQIYEAMQEAYTHAEGMRDQAREFALPYDAQTVFDEYWNPVLEKLDSPETTQATRRPRVKKLVF